MSNCRIYASNLYISDSYIISINFSFLEIIILMNNKKTITSSEEGEIHFGVNSLAGFEPISENSLQEILSDLKNRKLWRCNVCNDLHMGAEPPKNCPTCNTIDAYVGVDEKEFRSVLEVLNE